MSFSENIINIFDAVGKQFGIVLDWGNANVMPYVEQLANRIVNYEMFTSIAWIVFFVILFIIGIIIFKLGLKEYRREGRCSYDERYVIMFIVSAFLITISTTAMLVEVGDVIACVTLPEKTLIEFISNFKN